MNISFSADFVEEVKKIKKKDNELYKRIQKQIELFQLNPQHPSLRKHKLTGKLKDRWSISVSSSIRIVYFLGDDTAYFFAIGTHDQVYKN